MSVIIGERGGQRQCRRDNRIVKAVPDPCIGQLAPLPFERVTGLRRRGAEEQSKLHIIPVRFDVGVFIEVIHQRPGTGTVSQPAVRAVRTEVFTAERIQGKTADKGIAPVIPGIGHQ